MPTVTIQVNPSNEMVILGADGTPPASVTPRTIVATLSLRSVHFTDGEIAKAANAISEIVPDAPIRVVKEALRALFPDSTFESRAG